MTKTPCCRSVSCCPCMLLLPLLLCSQPASCSAVCLCALLLATVAASLMSVHGSVCPMEMLTCMLGCWVPIWLGVTLSFFVSACCLIDVCLPGCFPVYLSGSLSGCLSVGLSVCPCTCHFGVCLSVSLSVCESVCSATFCLWAHQSVHPPPACSSSCCISPLSTAASSAGVLLQDITCLYLFALLLQCFILIPYLVKTPVYPQTAKNVTDRMLDLVTYAVPVSLPTVLLLVVAVAGGRLGKAGIMLMAPEAVKQGAAVDVVCFDKTGTLTQSAVGSLPAQLGCCHVEGCCLTAT